MGTGCIRSRCKGSPRAGRWASLSTLSTETRLPMSSSGGCWPAKQPTSMSPPPRPRGTTACTSSTTCFRYPSWPSAALRAQGRQWSSTRSSSTPTSAPSTTGSAASGGHSPICSAPPSTPLTTPPAAPPAATPPPWMGALTSASPPTGCGACSCCTGSSCRATTRTPSPFGLGCSTRGRPGDAASSMVTSGSSSHPPRAIPQRTATRSPAAGGPPTSRPPPTRAPGGVKGSQGPRRAGPSYDGGSYGGAGSCIEGGIRRVRVRGQVTGHQVSPIQARGLGLSPEQPWG
mmetsp:Transcript_49099/g.87623  ORF Transcript_49099/g.87623 Transcript_49099/m.87623 type:complete len:288 (+) Transcript_49099:139-1002(+)